MTAKLFAEYFNPVSYFDYLAYSNMPSDALKTTC
jgi:hypothetical protein